MRLAARQARLIFVLLAAAYTAALVWQAARIGVTFDEPAHLAAAYMYWRGEDVLQPADAPPLTRLTSGWAPHVAGLEPNTATEAWRSQGQWDIGVQMLEGVPLDRADRAIFLTRLTFLPYALLLLTLVWGWARELLGEGAALVAALALALEPNLLAHAPLIKSDVPAAAALIASLYACWRYWMRPSPARLVVLAITIAFAIQVKYSVLPAAPLALLVVAGRQALERRWRRAVASAAAIAGCAYAISFALHQFDGVTWLGAASYEKLATGEHWSDDDRARLARVAWLPQPARQLSGLRFVSHHSQEGGFPAYLLGRRVEGADWRYFPLTLALKLPIPLQALLLAGAAAFFVRLFRRRVDAAELLLWLPALALFLFACQSRILIGYRHVMPLTPPLLLGAAYSLRGIWGSLPGRALAGGGLLWLAAASAGMFPQGLAYFNPWAGGPRHGWRYLADSNIDWGQNLPELAEFVEKRGIEKIHLAYFGKDLMWRRLRPESIEILPTPFCLDCVEGSRYRPEPGWYAISVNMLTGHFWPEPYQDYLEWFRDREPDARAGWSIYLYRVPAGR